MMILKTTSNQLIVFIVPSMHAHIRTHRLNIASGVRDAVSVACCSRLHLFLLRCGLVAVYRTKQQSIYLPVAFV
jgi:hypothetical protein